MKLFLDRINYYLISIDLMFLVGSITFFLLDRQDREKPLYRLLWIALSLVFVYENIAFYLAAKKTFNAWVYNIFFRHFATWVNLLIIRAFALTAGFKKAIHGFMISLLLFSGIPYLFGFIPFNDAGEYTSLLSGSFIIIACGLFFYELLSHDRYLETDPLRFPGFWICTFLLFFYSASFMILISYAYLIQRPNIYFVVIQITYHSALALYFVFLLTLVQRKFFPQTSSLPRHD